MAEAAGDEGDALVVQTLAGTGNHGFQDGPAASAQFTNPMGICADPSGSGVLFIADHSNDCIRALNTGTVNVTFGTVTIAPNHVQTLAGSDRGDQDGPAASAQFKFPKFICADPSGSGVVFIVDHGNHRIRALNTGTVNVTIGTVTIAPNHVQTLAGDGEYGFRDGPAVSAQFHCPMGICADPSGSSVLFIADYHNHRIRAHNLGTVKVTFGTVTIAPNHVETLACYGTGGSQFNNPIGICADPSGRGGVGGVGPAHVCSAGGVRVGLRQRVRIAPEQHAGGHADQRGDAHQRGVPVLAALAQLADELEVEDGAGESENEERGPHQPAEHATHAEA